MVSVLAVLLMAVGGQTAEPEVGLTPRRGEG